MHIVLDLGCRTNPIIDSDALDYEVYNVNKNIDLFVLLSH